MIGLNRMVGFGLSMLTLGIASLIAIPAMIRASGSASWGAIALGQSIGAVGAVLVAYGWGMSGPAKIANCGPSERRRAYLESVTAKVTLIGPVLLVTTGIAGMLGRDNVVLAVAGAASATSIGLTAEWYFVGILRPYVFLLVETMPRVGGTILGVLSMNAGAGALAGVVLQLAGVVVAFLSATAWVFASLRSEGAAPLKRRRLPDILGEQRHGVVASLGAAVYAAVPLLIVSAVAPAAQPLYALADKVQRQISVAITPLVTVLQGWVPRGRLQTRASASMWMAAILALVAGVGVWLAGPFLMDWLSDGNLLPGEWVRLLVAIGVSLQLVEAILAKAVLASYGKLKVVAGATLLSGAIALPLVALGSWLWGAQGALAGVSVGLACGIVIEFIACIACIGTPRSQVEGSNVAGRQILTGEEHHVV